MAGFDYDAAMDAVLTALRSHNTTTASPDLSASMSSRFLDENIRDGDPAISVVRQDRLPAIFVRISNAGEEFADIGATGPSGNLKFKTVVFDVFAIASREGATTERSNTVRAACKIAQNIEAVFQAEYLLSNTAIWCNPRATAVANVPLDPTGSWTKMVMIELEARYMFR